MASEIENSNASPAASALSNPSAGASGDAPQISLEIIRIVNASRIQNGLRHSDYMRYRQYCNRRLRRLYRSQRVIHGKKAYQKREITAEMVKQPKMLLIPLMQAERAWSYAMQLKEESTKNQRAKFHATRKMKKAAKYSEKLVLLCQAKTDSRTILEAEAYNSSMKGTLLLQGEKWEDALENFVKARKIYDQLGKVGDQDQRDICKQRVEELDPSIRFCKYNLGGSTNDRSQLIELTMQSKMDILTAQLNKVLEESRKKQVTSMREVEWRGKVVVIKTDKIREAFLSAQDASYELDREEEQEKKLDKYDKLFICYSDVLRLIREELSAAEAAHKSTKAETQAANLQFLQNYLNYLKLTRTVDRNLLLVESLQKRLKSPEQPQEGEKVKLSKPDDLARIYETLIQNMMDLEQLRDKDDIEQAKDIAASILSYKSFRCFYVGMSYSFASKWAEAMALFDSASRQSVSAIEHYQACSQSKTAEIEKLQQLMEKIRAEKSLVCARFHLELSTMKSSAQQQNNNLVDNVNVFDSSFLSKKQLIEFPPEFTAIHCKPLLFDLAFLACEFPSLEQRKKVQKGFFSFWKRS